LRDIIKQSLIFWQRKFYAHVSAAESLQMLIQVDMKKPYHIILDQLYKHVKNCLDMHRASFRCPRSGQQYVGGDLCEDQEKVLYSYLPKFDWRWCTSDLKDIHEEPEYVMDGIKNVFAAFCLPVEKNWKKYLPFCFIENPNFAAWYKAFLKRNPDASFGNLSTAFCARFCLNEKMKMAITYRKLKFLQYGDNSFMNGFISYFEDLTATVDLYECQLYRDILLASLSPELAYLRQTDVDSQKLRSIARAHCYQTYGRQRQAC
jgi:hypothetical protein